MRRAMVCWYRYRISFVLVAVLVTLSHRGACSEWTVEQLVTRLHVRERALPSVSLMITLTPGIGDDTERYLDALDMVDTATRGFFGITGRRDGRATDLNKGTLAAAEHYRWSATTDECLLERLGGPDATSEPVFRLCFDGSLWLKRGATSAGERVFIDTQTSEAPAVVYATGVWGPPWGGYVPSGLAASRCLRLSEWLRETTAKQGPPKIEVEPTGDVALTWRFDDAPPSIEPPQKASQILRVRDATVRLSQRFALAPIGFRVVPLLLDGPNAVPGEAETTGEWGEFETVSGIVLPRKLTIHRVATLRLPADGDRFTPMDKGGVRGLDFSRTVVKRFSIEKSLYSLRVLSTDLGADPLCRREYPAGTVVQDNRTGEVFQLTGSDSVVDARLKKAYERHCCAQLGFT
jgi:hypothetical protein